MKIDEEGKDKLNLLAEMAEIWVRKPYSFVFLGIWSSQVFVYVIKDVGSMHWMLEKFFHKGDDVKHFLGTIVVLTDKQSYTTLA